MFSRRRFLITCCVVLIAAVLPACTNTQVNRSHTALAPANAADSAIVYFLRPAEQRTRGVADNTVDIEFDDQRLMSLGEGEYVRLSFKPHKGFLVTKSLAMLTINPNPVPVTRAREFSFESGKTYFVLIQYQEEEFRGVYFVPKEIDEGKAKELAVHMIAGNPPAERNPIH